MTGTYPDAPFVDDSYDLSDLAGTPATLRLTLRHRPRPGPAGLVHRRPRGQGRRHGDLLSPTSRPPPTRRSTTAAAARACRPRSSAPTAGSTSSAAEGSPAEHAYLLEMRDRSGFDADGRGESDRGDARRSRPACCSPTPTRTTATATSAPTTRRPRARSTRSPSPAATRRTSTTRRSSRASAFSDAGAGHVDNYSDPSREDGQWRFDFDCLGFDVTSLAGAGPGPEAPGTYDLVRRRGLPHRPGLRDVQLRLGRGRPGGAAAPTPPRTERKPARRAWPPRPRPPPAAAVPHHPRRRLTVVLRLGSARADRRPAPRPVVRRLANRRLAAGRTLRSARAGCGAAVHRAAEGHPGGSGRARGALVAPGVASGR